MLQSSRAFSRRLRAMCAIGGLMLLLVACGDSDTEPTPTEETVAAAPTETVAPTATPEPSATPTEEPSPTPTVYTPPPTVAAPLYIPPTPIAVPTQPVEEVPEEEQAEIPDEEVPIDQEETGPEGPTVGELLYAEDLTTWQVGEYSFGHSYIYEGAYYIYNTSTLGEGLWSRTSVLDEADHLVSIDLVMTTPDAKNGWGCLISRADWQNVNFAYSLCINGWGESYAAYQTIDTEGTFHYDMLADIETRDALGAPTQVNNLAIMSYGSEFAFFINGHLIGTAEHFGEPQGGVGFFVSNHGEEHVEFGFANLEVWEVLP